ncbi:MAG: hypothetical protein ACOC3X_01845 [Nanoarchaeota archaeon]
MVDFDFNELKKELKSNILELSSAFFIIFIMLFILYFKTNYFISIIASVLILAIGFEKRGNKFDKIVSMFVIFLFSIAFIII